MIVIVTGVSGSGKTTVGAELARQLGWPFFEGDDFHPHENIAKMSQGIPLDDDDRMPWLQRIRKKISILKAENKSAVFACSALKQIYRDVLGAGEPGIVFVFLDGDFDVIYKRIENRTGHFMKAGLLKSQFAALEIPDDAIAFDVRLLPAEIVERIRHELRL